MARKVNVPPFVAAMETAPHVIFQVGPRYNPPVDNTLIMEVTHRTMGNGVSVLMDDSDVRLFVEWLSIEDEWESSYVIADTQTTATVRKRVHSMTEEDLLDISISWNGSGRTREITLKLPQIRELVTFLTTALSPEGWAGWLPPLAVPSTYHGHVWRVVERLEHMNRREMEPCRLCELQRAAQS